MNKELNIRELETLLNVTQTMIDNTLREANLNNANNLSSNKKLQKFTNYRSKIMTLIEEKLDENFKEN
jgi:hypothetical protein